MKMADRLYEERIEALKDAYDRRLSSLSEHVQQFFAEASGDEIYKAMQESMVSSTYAHQRLKEILLDCMSSEAEATINDLQTSLTNVRVEFKRLETEHQRVSNSYSKLEDNLKLEVERNSRLNSELRDLSANTAEKLRLKEQEWGAQLRELKAKMNSSRSLSDRLGDSEAEVFKLSQLSGSLKDELDRTRARLVSYDQAFGQSKQESQELNAVLAQTEASLHERDLEVADLHRRKSKLKEAYDRLTVESQHLASDRDSLVEKCASFEKEVYSTLQQEQKVNHEKERRYKAKIKQLKRKLGEHVDYGQQLEVKLQETLRGRQEAESSLQKAVNSLQSSLQSEREQWKKKLSESASDFSSKEADSASKHSLQISALQSQYQKMLDSRIADMQRDMEGQLSRSKKLDEELHAMMEERLHEVERDTISKLKHESLLSEKLREAKEEHRAELHEQQNKLEKRSLEAIVAAQQELAGIKQDWERQRTDREEKLAELRLAKTRLTEDLEELKRENARLIEDLNWTRAELESTRDHKASVSHELLELQVLHNSLAKEVECTKQELARTLKDKEHLELKVSDTKDELERKTSQLYRTESHFETTFNKLAEDHQSTEMQKRQRLNDVEAELKALNKAKVGLEADLAHARQRVSDLESQLQDARFTEQRRADADLQAIIEGKNTIAKLEYIVSQHDEDKQHLTSRVSDLKSALKAADTEALSLRDRLTDSETRLSVARSELTEYAKTQSHLGSKLSYISSKAKQNVKTRALTLKKQVSQLKSSVENELTATVKHVGGMFESILAKFIEISDQHRHQYESKVAENSNGINRTWKHKLHKVEKDLTTQTQGTIKGLEDKAKVLERQVSELKQTRADLLEELEKERRNARHYKVETERLDERLRQNSQTFDLLNTEVHQEADRIRRKAEAQIERSRQEQQEKHEAEILMLQGQISELQLEISKLQIHSSEKLTLTKTELLGDSRALRLKYEERIAKLEKQIEVEKERKSVLQVANESFAGQLDHLKRDHQSALAALHEQIKREKQEKAIEIERLLNYRVEAVREIEALTRRLTDQQREADEKAEQASRLARENREQFNVIKDLENRYDMQSRELSYFRPSTDFTDFKLSRAELEAPDYKPKSRSSYRP